MMSENNEDNIEFLNESREYLDQIEPTLISWLQDFTPEKSSEDDIAIVFRVFHSIKGVAGFLGFGVVQKLTHRIEELLDRIRSRKKTLVEKDVHLFMKGCEHLRTLMSLIESSSSDESFSDEADEFIANVSAQIDEESIDLDSVLSRENNTFFDVFNSSYFLTQFNQEAEKELTELENSLFGLLDGPENVNEIFNFSLEKSEFILFNFHKVNYSEGIKFLSVLKEYLEFTIKNTVYKADHLSILFALTSFVKNHYDLDSTDEKNTEEFEKVEQQVRALMLFDEDIKKDERPGENTASKSSGQKNQAISEMKIDTEKIDKLIGLIEDLGVVSGVLSRDVDFHNIDEYAYIQSTGKLQQITGDLQDVAMSVRLVPLTSVFRKMNRLVYDVSTKLGKKVRLKLIGESTTIDKTTLERLQDPLVHIFRNAIDHGLETPEERLDSGKSEEGEIELSAYITGDEFVLSIKDDGKGIDKDFIFQKALDKGIVQESDVLTDNEKYALIMEAGFSTNEVVTDFSGRGVGMDVVRESIESLNGKIEIDSELGKGTQFLISIPLTSTLVEMVMVKVAQVVYSVRISSVKEFFQSNRIELVSTPDGKSNINIRNKIYPVYELSDLKINEVQGELVENPTYLLVENKGNKIVLVADEIVGINQNVVKPLPEYFQKIKGVSGCCVIGNDSDSICWNLDINSIMMEMK
jgi:two-component system chemotaxis sensor kinase CheA